MSNETQDLSSNQRLIDALAVIGPLAQQLEAAARQQAQDAAKLLDA